VSEENVELVRSIYALWAEEKSARDLIADDLEYVNPPYAVEPGTHRDRRKLAAIREVYPDFRVEPEEFFDVGDDIVVLGTARGTAASGITTQWRQGYIWTIREGKAVRLRWFNDPKEALDAAGLDASDE
jgi:ketosteroid isomerase-like protein